MNDVKISESTCSFPYDVKFGTIVKAGKFQTITTEKENIPALDVIVRVGRDEVKSYIYRRMAIYFKDRPTELIGADVVMNDTLFVEAENNKLKYRHSYYTIKLTLPTQL